MDIWRTGSARTVSKKLHLKYQQITGTGNKFTAEAEEDQEVYSISTCHLQSSFGRQNLQTPCKE